MKTIAWDLGHCSTWVLEPKQALEMWPDNPEYAYYGHLDHLLRNAGRYHTRTLIEKWTLKGLEGIDGVIVPHLAHPHVEKGHVGTPEFSADEVEALTQFVSDGGGVFVIGEYSPSYWRVNT